MGEAGVENPGVGSGVTSGRTQRWLGRHRRAHGPCGALVSLCKTLEMEEKRYLNPLESVFGDLDPWHLVWQGLAEQNEAGASEHP